MAGEYQLAQRLIESGLETARENNGMDEVTFARAMMHELTEHNRKSRTNKDVIGELEQVIRFILDEGDPVITRGS